MTIAYDNATTYHINNASSPSFSHEVGVGDNRILFVVMHGYTNGSGLNYVATVTYNSVSMTKLHEENTDYGRFTIFYLVNPASGSNTVAVSLNTNCYIMAGAVSYSGVHQTNPYNTPSTFNRSYATRDTTPSVSSLAGGDGFVLSFLGFDDATISVTPGTNQNERFELATTPGNRGVWGSDETSDDEASATLTAATSYLIWASVLKEAPIQTVYKNNPLISNCMVT